MKRPDWRRCHFCPEEGRASANIIVLFFHIEKKRERKRMRKRAQAERWRSACLGKNLAASTAQAEHPTFLRVDLVDSDTQVLQALEHKQKVVTSLAEGVDFPRKARR